MVHDGMQFPDVYGETCTVQTGRKSEADGQLWNITKENGVTTWGSTTEEVERLEKLPALLAAADAAREAKKKQEPKPRTKTKRKPRSRASRKQLAGEALKALHAKLLAERMGSDVPLDDIGVFVALLKGAGYKLRVYAQPDGIGLARVEEEYGQWTGGLELSPEYVRLYPNLMSVREWRLSFSANLAEYCPFPIESKESKGPIPTADEPPAMRRHGNQIFTGYAVFIERLVRAGLRTIGVVSDTHDAAYWREQLYGSDAPMMALMQQEAQ